MTTLNEIVTAIQALPRRTIYMNAHHGGGNMLPFSMAASADRLANQRAGLAAVIAAYQSGSIGSEQDAGRVFWHTIRDLPDRSDWRYDWWNSENAHREMGAVLHQVRHLVDSYVPETPVASGYANRSIPEEAGRRADRYVALPDGTIGMVPEWTLRERSATATTYRVWSNLHTDREMTPGTDFYWLVPGDTITRSNGTNVTYSGSGANEFNVETSDGTLYTRDLRQSLWGTPAITEWWAGRDEPTVGDLVTYRDGGLVMLLAADGRVVVGVRSGVATYATPVGPLVKVIRGDRMTVTHESSAGSGIRRGEVREIHSAYGAAYGIRSMRNGTASQWIYVGHADFVLPEGATPAKPDPTVTIDGVEYVRKDVVDADVTAMKAALHAEADRRGWCSDYDDIMRRADGLTEYVKMGHRREAMTATWETTVVIRRTFESGEGDRSEAGLRNLVSSIAEAWPIREMGADPYSANGAIEVVSCTTEPVNLTITRK